MSAEVRGWVRVAACLTTYALIATGVIAMVYVLGVGLVELGTVLHG